MGEVLTSPKVLFVVLMQGNLLEFGHLEVWIARQLWVKTPDQEKQKQRHRGEDVIVLRTQLFDFLNLKQCFS